MLVQVIPNKGAVVSGLFDARFYSVTRDMPGRKKWHDAKFVFELSSANIEYFQKHFPNAVWSNADPLNKIAELRAQEAATRAAKAAPVLPPEAETFEFKTKPFAHQHKAFFLARKKKNFAYLMEMGTGKTKVLIDDAAYAWSVGEIDTLIVTAPNGVHRQWIEEQIPVHMPDWVQYEALVYTSNHTKKWLKRADEVLGSSSRGKLRIIAIHFDAFRTDKGKKFVEKVLMTGRSMWALDESTRIKNQKAQRTKTILKLAPLAMYRRIMSGAPITKGVHNLYTQFRFLDTDIMGFNSFYSFRNHFCVCRPIPNAPFGAVKIVGVQNIDQLTDIIDGHSFRVLRKDCTDLPAKIYLTREVPLSEEQRKAYRELKTDSITRLKDGQIVSAPIILSQLLRLQQILSGFVPDEDGNIIRIPSHRIETLIDGLEEVNGKAVVWCRFHEDLDMIGEALKKEGIGFAEYSGRNKDTRHLSKQEFIESQYCDVLLGNASAGGTGTDGLQKVSSDMFYYNNDFNSETRWQSEDRIDRIGKADNSVSSTYTDLIVPRSIDTQILNVIRQNRELADSVLDARQLAAFLDEDGV